MTVLDEMAKGTRQYHRKLNKIIEPISRYFGVTNMGYVWIDNNNRLINLHNNLPFIETCLEKQYYVDDPHMVTPKHIGSGVVHWSSYKKEEYLEGLLKDMTNTFNICHGITYIQKDETGYRVFGFATEKDNHLIHDRIMSSGDCMPKFIEYLKREIAPIEEELMDSRIDFAELKGDEFYNQEAIIPVDEYAPMDRFSFLDSIGAVNKDLLKIKFSKREKQAIKHYLHGRTAEQTAEIMCLSPRTIEGYMESIKNKLNVRYKRQIIDIAMEMEHLGLL